MILSFEESLNVKESVWEVGEEARGGGAQAVAMGLSLFVLFISSHVWT